MKLSLRAAFEVDSAPVDVETRFQEGALNILTGPNGVGKTSFFTFIKSKPELFSGKSLAFVNQPPFRPLTDMKVKDAFRALTEEAPGAKSWQDCAAVNGLKISSLLEKNVSQLSGGENQRVKLAMALLLPFDILFADEPLQNLDFQGQKAFVRVFERLVESGKTVILIEHNLEKFAGAQTRLHRMRAEGAGLRIFHD